MHELSLCRAMMGLVMKALDGHTDARVQKVCIDAGILSGIDHAVMQQAFAVAARQTPAENAVLEIRTVEGLAQCVPCNKAFTLSRYTEPCPRCGEYAANILEGEGMILSFLEIG